MKRAKRWRGRRGSECYSLNHGSRQGWKDLADGRARRERRYRDAVCPLFARPDPGRITYGRNRNVTVARVDGFEGTVEIQGDS